MSMTTLIRAPATFAIVRRRKPPCASFLPDLVDPERIGVECDSIVRDEIANLAKDGNHRLQIGIAEAEEVQVSSWAVRIFETGCHQHRSLESKPSVMWCLGKPMEKALQDISSEKELKRLVPFLGDGEKASPDRGAHVADGPSHQR